MAKQLQNIPKILRVLVLVALIVFPFQGLAKANEVTYCNVRVSDDSKGIAVDYKTTEETVREFFEEQNIVLEENDKIDVELDGFIVNNMKINIVRAQSTYNGVRVVDNSEKNSGFFKTNKETVGEFFEEQGINLDDLDLVSPSLDSKIEDGMRILINRAYNVNLVIDGKTKKTVKTNEVTAGRLVLELKQDDGTDYILEDKMSSSFELKPDMTLNLRSVKEVFNVEKQSIPFETETVENPELEEGKTQVKTEGTEGVREIKTKTTFVGGKETSSEVVSDEITVQPVNKVIEKGTKKEVVETSGEQEINAKKKIRMRATAYSSQETGSNVTASGMKARVGVVAVDTKVIPLGTKLYIEGYGYAVAGDTGGAIKGNKIDLYFNTSSECRQFGVKHVDVYVLA